MKRSTLLTICLFYVGWFGSIFLARTPYSEISLSFPALLVGFLLFKRELSAPALCLATVLSLVGVAFDSALVSENMILAKGQSTWMIPIWLIAIWILFSFSIINLGPLLNWPYWLAALLGGIFGPLSYKSGEVFEVLTFLTPWTFWVYAGFWALAFPIVLRLSKRFA